MAIPALSDAALCNRMLNSFDKNTQENVLLWNLKQAKKSIDALRRT